MSLKLKKVIQYIIVAKNVNNNGNSFFYGVQYLEFLVNGLERVIYIILHILIHCIDNFLQSVSFSK